MTITLNFSGPESKKAKRRLNNNEERALGCEDSGSDSENKDKLQDRLKSEKAEKVDKKKQSETVKRKIVESDETNSDSGPMTVKKTPEIYGKKKVKLKKRSNSHIKDKSKSAVISESDADSESEDKDAEGNITPKTLSRLKSIDFSDSDDETLDKIAAKQSGKNTVNTNENNTPIDDSKNSGHLEKEKKKKLDTKRKTLVKSVDGKVVKSGNTPKNAKLGQVIIITESDTSTGGSPVVKSKVKKAVKLESESEDNTRNLPLLKREKVKEPCADKGQDSNSDSDISTGDTPLAKKIISKKRKGTKESDVDSESETPLAKMKVSKKTKGKKSEVATDSDASTGDTPLAKKRTSLRRTVKSQSNSESDGDKTLEAESISGNDNSNCIALVANKKKSRKQKDLENVSDASTGDTPLAKKKLSRKKLTQENNSSDSDTFEDLSTRKQKPKQKRKSFNKTENDMEDKGAAQKKRTRRFSTDSRNSDLSTSSKKDSKTETTRESSATVRTCVSDNKEEVMISSKNDAQTLDTKDTDKVLENTDKGSMKRPIIISSDTSTNDSPLKKRKPSSGLIVVRVLMNILKKSTCQCRDKTQKY